MAPTALWNTQNDMAETCHLQTMNAIDCHSEPERSGGEESLSRGEIEILRSLRSLRMTGLGAIAQTALSTSCIFRSKGTQCRTALLDGCRHPAQSAGYGYPARARGQEERRIWLSDASNAAQRTPDMAIRREQRSTKSVGYGYPARATQQV